MSKPNYDELADYIKRLSGYNCGKQYPERCDGCILFLSGFCAEAEQLTKRLKEKE